MTESDGFGWGSVLLAVVTGLGLGGGLPPLVRWIGGYALRRAGDALGERLTRRVTGTFTTPASSPVPAVSSPRVEADIPAPPPTAVPEVVRTEHEFVPYEQPNGELAAYKQALKDLVQHYPGTADWARQLEAFKEQILAGIAKRRR